MFLLCPMIRGTKFRLSEDGSRLFLVSHELNLFIIICFWTRLDDTRSHFIWQGTHFWAQSGMVHSFLNCHSSGGSEADRSAILWGLLFPGTTLTLFIWFCWLTFYVTVLTQRRMWGIPCHMSSQMHKLHKASSLACFGPEYSHGPSALHHSLSWGDHFPLLVSVSLPQALRL